VRQPPIAASKGAASKPRKDQLTLEETLEILGASELQIDDGRNELITIPACVTCGSRRRSPMAVRNSDA
jgi:hypothetical protein